jgi:vacuolar-type H+-ATPase subunit I/STV1
VDFDFYFEEDKSSPINADIAKLTALFGSSKAIDIIKERSRANNQAALNSKENSIMPHYDNSNGSLYQFAHDQNLNAWEFDLVKRIVRCRKKDEFKKDLLDKVKENIQHIKNEKERVRTALEAIEQIETVFASDANFLLFRVDNALDVYKKLADSGVIIRFRGNEPHCENCLRLTIGTTIENDQFLEALTLSLNP